MNGIPTRIVRISYLIRTDYEIFAKESFTSKELHERLLHRTLAKKKFAVMDHIVQYRLL